MLVFKQVGNNRSSKSWERILGCVYELFISVRDKEKKLKSYLLISKLINRLEWNHHNEMNTVLIWRLIQVMTEQHSNSKNKVLIESYTDASCSGILVGSLNTSAFQHEAQIDIG